MRMVGKVDKIWCGCCDTYFPGAGKKRNRIKKKMIKAREKRGWKRDVLTTDLQFR